MAKEGMLRRQRERSFRGGSGGWHGGWGQHTV